jgi:hypothetical protein
MKAVTVPVLYARKYRCYEADYLQDKSFIEGHICVCPVVSASNLDIVSRMKIDPRRERSLVSSSETRIAFWLPADGVVLDILWTKVQPDGCPEAFSHFSMLLPAKTEGRSRGPETMKEPNLLRGKSRLRW